jgi:predicted flap endonuclease-1-like 5' DNA nuclease
MTYLLAIGWEWFAGAFAIGLLVGLVTTTRAPGAVFSGGWMIFLAVLILAGLGAASFMEVLPGRDGLMLDIALLASLAYFFGLPVGGGLRSLLPAPAARAPEPRQKPKAIVRGPTPAPKVAKAAAEIAPPVAAPAVKVANAAEPEQVAKSLPGAPPQFLLAPVDGKADDLSKIKGVGPKSAEKLKALGVYHYEQIAAWNLDNARWIGARIGAPGRVERGKWIQQARDLLSHVKSEARG